MQQVYVKQQPAALKEKELDHQRFNDELFRTIQNLGIKLPFGELTNRKTDNNNALYSAGTHKGFTLKTDDFIDAVAGANIDVSVSISSESNRINNMYFKTSITLTNTASVIFNGCRFDGEVTLADGAKAQFVGCTFRTTLAKVNNAGAAANVYVQGGFRTSTAHTNVTVISEVVI